MSDVQSGCSERISCRYFSISTKLLRFEYVGDPETSITVAVFMLIVNKKLSFFVLPNILKILRTEDASSAQFSFLAQWNA